MNTVVSAVVVSKESVIDKTLLWGWGGGGAVVVELAAVVLVMVEA